MRMYSARPLRAVHPLLRSDPGDDHGPAARLARDAQDGQESETWIALSVFQRRTW